MTITFPTTLDTFSNPVSTDLLENVSSALDHDVQHSNANDAIEALEAKVGVTNSAVTTSHDYKLSGVATGDKAVSKIGTETLTNKTLTAPKITAGSDAKGDIFQLSDSTGTLTRIRATLNADIISWDSSLQQWAAIPNPAGSNASTTVKGVVELATLAETLSRTTTGATGALLAVTPDNLTTVLTYDYAADSVGTDSYAITVTPAPTAYVTGQKFTFKAGTANTGGATLNVNGLGAKTIKKNATLDLTTGDIVANQLVTVTYDGTNFQYMNSIANIFKVGSTTKDVSTTTTTTIAHGLGIIPKFVRIMASRVQSSAAGGLPLLNSHGVYDGTTQSCIYVAVDTNGGPFYASNIDATHIIHYGHSGTGSADSTSLLGTISFDATNITITWSGTTASGTLNIIWEAHI